MTQSSIPSLPKVAFFQEVNIIDPEVDNVIESTIENQEELENQGIKCEVVQRSLVKSMESIDGLHLEDGETINHASWRENGDVLFVTNTGWLIKAEKVSGSYVRVMEIQLEKGNWRIVGDVSNTVIYNEYYVLQVVEGLRIKLTEVIMNADPDIIQVEAATPIGKFYILTKKRILEWTPSVNILIKIEFSII